MKTGFVTLLMIGIAAAQMPIYTITPGEKPACIVIDTSKAGWHFDFCHLFVAELPPKPGTMIYTLPAEIPATVPKPAKPPAKKAAPKCSGCGTVTDLGPCTADWCTQAVTPITQQGAPDLSQMKPVIKMCSGLTGECKVSSEPIFEGGTIACTTCALMKKVTQRNDDITIDVTPCGNCPRYAPPLDVPAIRKTRIVHPKGTCWAEGQQAVCAMQKDDTEDYWDCKDPDAYSLQISVSGKAANCHRIAP